MFKLKAIATASAVAAILLVAAGTANADTGDETAPPVVAGVFTGSGTCSVVDGVKQYDYTLTWTGASGDPVYVIEDPLGTSAQVGGLFDAEGALSWPTTSSSIGVYSEDGDVLTVTATACADPEPIVTPTDPTPVVVPAVKVDAPKGVVNTD
jgi:hypothetical protein